MNKEDKLISLIQGTAFLRYTGIEDDPYFEESTDSLDDFRIFLKDAIFEYQFSCPYESIEFITDHDHTLETTFRYIAECNSKGENMASISSLDTNQLAWYLLKCMSDDELGKIWYRIEEIFEDNAPII